MTGKEIVDVAVMKLTKLSGIPEYHFGWTCSPMIISISKDKNLVEKDVDSIMLKEAGKITVCITSEINKFSDSNFTSTKFDSSVFEPFLLLRDSKSCEIFDFNFELSVYNRKPYICFVTDSVEDLVNMFDIAIKVNKYLSII